MKKILVIEGYSPVNVTGTNDDDDDIDKTKATKTQGILGL